MSISGENLIGGQSRRGTNGELRGIAAATGEQLEPGFGGATAADLEEACALADAAFDTFRETSLEARAAFLEAIAENILAIGPELIERCVAESGLPKGRIEGERGRTVGQLRLFASVVREGRFLDVRIDKALPERTPLPRVDLRMRNIAVGPVAVFGASNFPLAFSVAGGDTASAFAAGCPVVVKAHSAHPGTSELVGRAVQKAVTDAGLPAGTFALLFDTGREIGQGLVADRRIKAVGFTGSRTGGTALMTIAANRPEPIPVYAEMSSINPVIVLENALAARSAKIGTDFVAALTLGAGQFCTNPGLILTTAGKGYDEFVAAAGAAVDAAAHQTMLTNGIARTYRDGVGKLGSHGNVKTLAGGRVGEGGEGAALFETTDEAFLAYSELQEEVFGASSLIIRCKDASSLKAVIEHLEGQLTIAVQLDEADRDEAKALLPLLEKKAGRIIANGFGTGVEVAHAMVHGGPFPATSDGRSTSVGSLAIARFLRPVSYQSLTDALLPEALRDSNPWNVPQRIDPAA
ncbi:MULTISPECIES: aldehyde dehydrogenase (NADP(+)) [unclassified Aureimonas]|uniref:aldehyde dehydrogenase (NADP(+)) n=1 Tax=unclassified Aureimonas TaxID=2615206 RepID=UPI0006F4F46B|nr:MULTISPECIES: aldehyde dehydrogenase (NADP(+)) [unclassified Aureimonas]KQT62049.1 2,5-dioxovalerate dehydrogenase [Aureimonas sp. Leaf460]KQT69580.1 2,5-dioxovalerate dehydrogenase [Aureimonas sp. Leaf427]